MYILPSVITADDNCNSFEKRVIINYKIIIIIIIRKICLFSHQECTGG
jgi:hypothetical protein